MRFSGLGHVTACLARSFLWPSDAPLWLCTLCLAILQLMGTFSCHDQMLLWTFRDRFPHQRVGFPWVGTRA